MPDDIFAQVVEAVADTFDLPAGEITRESAKEQFEEWDSVGHLNLMLMLEEAFDIQLDIAEMERLTSVGAIVDFLQTGG